MWCRPDNGGRLSTGVLYGYTATGRVTSLGPTDPVRAVAEDLAQLCAYRAEASRPGRVVLGNPTSMAAPWAGFPGLPALDMSRS